MANPIVRMYTVYNDLPPGGNTNGIQAQRDKEVLRMLKATRINKFPCSLDELKKRENIMKYITHIIPHLCILCVVSDGHCWLIRDGDSEKYESPDAAYSSICGTNDYQCITLEV